MSHELTCSFAHGHCDSDPSAAAEQHQKEESTQSEASVSYNFISGLTSCADSGNTEPGNRRPWDDTSIVEENDSSDSEADNDSNGRSPDYESSQTSESVHEDEGKDDGES